MELVADFLAIFIGLDEHLANDVRFDARSQLLLANILVLFNLLIVFQFNLLFVNIWFLIVLSIILESFSLLSLESSAHELVIIEYHAFVVIQFSN